MSLAASRAVISTALLASVAGSACVVRLDDPYNAYSADGDVTGAAADCTAPPAEGHAAPTGPAAARIVGRTASASDDPKGTTRITWPSTTISARFSGVDSVYMKLQITGGHVAANATSATASSATGYDTAPQSTYYTVTVDGGPQTLVTVDGTQSGPQSILVASGLGSDMHEITIVRESDSAAGAHLFYGLYADAAGQKPLKFQPATVRPRRVQVIANGEGTGAGVLGENATCGFDYATERATLDFATLAATTLDAELTAIARDTSTYPNVDRSQEQNAPAVYGCADPSVLPASLPCISAGDLTKDPTPPQVIVIALGPNDIGDPTTDFQTRYETFVKSVRASYPKAQIFCALPSTITDLNTNNDRTNAKSAIHGAVADIDDPRVYAMDFPDQGSENGLGCQSNPSPRTHQIMAGILATAIHEKTCW